jgi:hypothetical protein
MSLESHWSRLARSSSAGGDAGRLCTDITVRGLSMRRPTLDCAWLSQRARPGAAMEQWVEEMQPEKRSCIPMQDVAPFAHDILCSHSSACDCSCWLRWIASSRRRTMCVVLRASACASTRRADRSDTDLEAASSVSFRAAVASAAESSADEECFHRYAVGNGILSGRWRCYNGNGALQHTSGRSNCLLHLPMGAPAARWAGVSLRIWLD